MRLIQAACSTLLGLSLAACQPALETSGIFLTDSETQAVRVGMDVRELEALVGPPSYISALDPDLVAYIGTRFEVRLLQNPKPLERRILALDISGGRVQSLVQFSLQDGRQIFPNSNRTPTNGRTISLVEELLGNIGRF